MSIVIAERNCLLTRSTSLFSSNRKGAKGLKHSTQNVVKRFIPSHSTYHDDTGKQFIDASASSNVKSGGCSTELKYHLKFLFPLLFCNS